MSGEVKITLRGGTVLTAEECKIALDEALQIIEKVGTTGINHTHQKAEKWLENYYPGFA